MIRKKRKYTIILIIAFLMIACVELFKIEGAFGSDGEGSEGPLQVDPGFKPLLGTYYYKADFNNVSIGTACIAIDREGDLYKVQVIAQTVGTIDHLYRLRYRGEALMDTDPVSPVETKLQQQIRSTGKDTTIKFEDNGTIKTVEKKSENGSTVKYDVRSLQTERFTLDPFSAAYLVRGLDWKVGVEKVFDVYPGRHQYELRLKCDSTAIIEVAGEKRNAWVIVPKLTYLDPEKRAEALKKKPASMKIYVSADERKDVLEIDASHTLGNLRIFMDKFEPAENQMREGDVAGKGGDVRSTKEEVQGKEMIVPNKNEEIQGKEGTSVNKETAKPVSN
jgi:Protein of unknown function (DUF3108)